MARYFGEAYRLLRRLHSLLEISFRVAQRSDSDGEIGDRDQIGLSRAQIELEIDARMERCELRDEWREDGGAEVHRHRDLQGPARLVQLAWISSWADRAWSTISLHRS